MSTYNNELSCDFQIIVQFFPYFIFKKQKNILNIKRKLNPGSESYWKFSRRKKKFVKDWKGKKIPHPFGIKQL